MRQAAIDGIRVRVADLVAAQVSGWALEFLPEDRPPASSPPPGAQQFDTGILSWGTAGRVRWWTWSVAGHTPAIAASGDHITVLFDGRIDDREAVRRALDLEHDTGNREIVLAAAHKWGAAASCRLIGEFSIATIDHRLSEVVLGVDFGTMGEAWWWKPESGPLVASCDPLVLSKWTERLAIDTESVVRYVDELPLRDGRSGFRGIGFAHPGRPIVTAGGTPVATPGLDAAPRVDREVESFGEAVESVSLALELAAADRLDSGPGIILLSGGVDSSAAASAASRCGRGLIGAVAFGSAIEGVDETQVSERLTDRIGLAHYVLPVDDLAPFTAPFDDAETWCGRRGSPGPFEPARNAFGAIIEAAYEEAAGLGAKVAWAGDRGDLAIGMGTRSPMRTMFQGIGTQDASLFREGWRDLRVDVHQRGAGALGDVLRIVLGRLDAYRHRGARPKRQSLASFPVARSTGSGFAPGPRAARWRLWRSPYIDLEIRASAFLARRHGLRVTDPWSDLRVIRAVLALAQPLIDPPGPGSKQLGRAVVSRLLEGWQPEFRPNRIASLWRHGLEHGGYSTALDLAREPALSGAGLDRDRVLQATVQAQRAGNMVPGLRQAWDVAWWLRAARERGLLED